MDFPLQVWCDSLSGCVGGTLYELFLDWVGANFVIRWAVVTLLIGSPASYVRETIRYWRLRKQQKRDPDTVQLAPVSIRGGILDTLGAGRVALAMRTELLVITETLRRLQEPAPYLAPPAARDDAYFLLGLRKNVPVPIELPGRLHEQELVRIEEGIVLRIGQLSLPISAIVNFIQMFVTSALPVYGRKKYKDSLIQVSMAASGKQTRLTVYRIGEYAGTSRYRRSADDQTDGRPVVFTVTKSTKTLNEVTSLIRDAVFMVLQFHGSLRGRHWLGMRNLVDGLVALEEYRQIGQTERAKPRDRAKECFLQAALADTNRNHHALYFHAVMTMVDRTAESIHEATRHLERALSTDDLQLRALVQAGLGFCYAQQIHRLGERDNFTVLELAYRHAEAAEEDWASYRVQKRVDERTALIPYTQALVSLSDGRGKDHKGRDRKRRFADAARLCVEAMHLEPENAMFYNMLGWILLKFASLPEGEAPPDLDISTPSGLSGASDGSMAKRAEACLHHALTLQPRSKLTFANLCTLYSTRHYVRERKHYLARCRHNGVRAVELDPEYINGYRDLTVALVRYGELEEAKEYYQKALALADDPDKDAEIIGDVVEEVKKRKGLSEAQLQWWQHPTVAPHAPDGWFGDVWGARQRQ